MYFARVNKLNSSDFSLKTQLNFFFAKIDMGQLTTPMIVHWLRHCKYLFFICQIINDTVHIGQEFIEEKRE